MDNVVDQVITLLDNLTKNLSNKAYADVLVSLGAQTDSRLDALVLDSEKESE